MVSVVYTRMVASGRSRVLHVSLRGKVQEAGWRLATTAWLPGVESKAHAPAPRLRFFNDGTVGASEGDFDHEVKDVLNPRNPMG